MSARGHDADRPWGHWLRLEPRHASQFPHFVDEDGRGWRTVREAFWVGRLGMPLVGGEVPDEQIELVHAILSTRLAAGRDRVFPDVLADLTAVHFMHSWLASAGLLARGTHPLDSGLSAEGLSVVRMLDVTRPQPAGRQRPCRATIDELLSELRGGDDGEDRRARIEDMGRGWEVAFLRRAIAGREAVILVRRGDGPIPVMTTVWMLRFPDEHLRDGFYDRLCDRLERWPAWGAIAGTYGGPELTNHLLQMFASEPVHMNEPRQAQTPPRAHGP